MKISVLRTWGIIFGLIALGGLIAVTILDQAPSWSSAGQGLANLRFQPKETLISPANVNQLKVKWTYLTGGDVSATPAVLKGVVYDVDWGGNLFAVNADTGAEIWKIQIPAITGQASSIARTTPLIVDDEVIVGDNNKGVATHNGANIIAVRASTGAFIWKTQVDPHPAAIITGSPIANNGIIYVPVSSNEELQATVPGYRCCTFRGSVVALNARTGKLLWQTFTEPSNGGSPGGFSGNAIWGPLALDTTRNQLYAGTGDNYSVPAETEQCEIANQASGNTASCTNSNDHVDSVIALDLTTGKQNWTTKVLNYDTWIVDCIIPTAPGATPCPSPAGPDFDFTGGGPNLVGNIVGIGQKSGVYWALNADNGSILWRTTVGPGSDLGGTMWGTASDGTNFYVPISNFGQTSYQLANNGPTINWGSWAALNVNTGKFVWQTADPTHGALDLGGNSVANGIVYVGSMSGTMYALNASTGSILWSFASGGSVLDAPAIVSGVVYWGSGYSNFRSATHGTGNNKLFALSLGGT